MEPAENEKLLMSCTDSMTLDSVTSAIPSQSLREIFSLNTSIAMSDVATISKLFKSDAFAADVLLMPIISAMGAAISSTTMPMV